VTDDELRALLDQAKAAFDALSPEEQTEHRIKQYASFAYGNCKLSGVDITLEEAERIVRAGWGTEWGKQ